MFGVSMSCTVIQLVTNFEDKTLKEKLTKDTISTSIMEGVYIIVSLMVVQTLLTVCRYV